MGYVGEYLGFNIKDGYFFQAAICRCSQPLAGFSARCVEDEQMLHGILKSNPKSKYMYVVDTRPKVNKLMIVHHYFICNK